jgi:hypothetical protein
MKTWFLLSALACTVFVSTTVKADGMRCDGKLVSNGDTMYDVQGRCGAPDAVRQHVELRTIRTWVEGPCFRENGVLRCGQFVEQTIQVVVDEWTYDFGPQTLIKLLTFEQGRLLRLATGSYGIKES